MQAFGYEPRMAVRDGAGGSKADAQRSVGRLKWYARQRKMVWIQERFRSLRVAFVDGLWIPEPRQSAGRGH